ncbi:MAG: 2-oxoacid:acceptor oxidoreductase subunit alpha, partial [Candidatus Aenigmarchaeota archaeon]|nr:2-oxoacid:acceptor oxidoreductase subunit alpha [Candidatus Aenigmarchaeota archaeon]
AGVIISKIFNELGYYVFVYDDYQSLVRGGHNFSIVRISDEKIYTHNEKVNLMVAFNQDTVEKHSWRTNDIIFDGDVVETSGEGIKAQTWAKEKGSLLLRNSIFIGSICKYFGVELGVAEKTIRKSFKKMIDENLEALKFGYDSVENKYKLEKIGEPKKVMTGNEAISLGAVAAGMKIYIAYPMTPATSILHYLASKENELNVVTAQVENEISVANMAVGAAFAGVRSMVGTSGGGLALMGETISMCAMSETPVLFVNSQRAGPSTGVPTYTMQADLNFALNIGHGDVTKITIAPGDPEESYYLAAKALNLVWKYQIPGILLVDKHISESTSTVELKEVKKEDEKLWNGTGEYKRYLLTDDGISPLAFPGQITGIKGSSYEHDERGLTIEEETELIKKMQEKRLKKMEILKEELKKEETVKTYGDGDIVLLTWGSTKGACIEVAKELGLKVVQPLYLEPMPTWELEKHLKGKRVIAVEVNATGQLANILGIKEKILKYDGRPFTPDELKRKLEEIL